ncbi:MAG: hypothetical protein GY768_15025 [Planctomycetaceae bacterium]|nr:hypothetical protein [Planctomycetaceae bacterium]
MAWLTTTKLLPPLRTGTPPRYNDVLPSEAVQLPPERWSIRLNQRAIGEASNQIQREADGRGSISSQITIPELSLKDLVSQRFGGLSASLLTGFGGNSANAEPLHFHLENEMAFDHFGQLTGFDCVVDVADLKGCITLRGTVLDDNLQLVGYLKLPDANPAKEPVPKIVHKGQIKLPPDSLVADSLSPRSRFGRLRVGQTWTFQSYRPLTPTHPLQTIEATVESRETIEWNSEQLRAYHVVYRRPVSAGLSIDQALGHVWVRADGLVLRQSVRWGSLELTFERLPTPPKNSSISLLAEERVDD